MGKTKNVCSELARVDSDLKNLLYEIKESENLDSLREASKFVADQFKKKKRGQLSEYAVPIILATALGAALLALGVLYYETGTLVSTSSINQSITGINDTVQFMINAPSNFDYLFLLLFVGAHLVLFIVTYLIPTTPIFVPFYLIGGIVIWLTTPIISNFYEAISTSNIISTVAANMPIMNTIMLQLPYIELIALCILLIVFFGKRLGVQQ